MITRIGHIALRVADLDRAVQFQRDVVGMVETDRAAGASYLTCNDRHHELILVEDPQNRGYDHIALEVAEPADLERIARRAQNAGGTQLGAVYDGEPGIDRALKLQGPEGHVFKLFVGMQDGGPPPAGDRPIKFEHVSLKVRNTRRFERFLAHGLGMRFSDRMGALASWWRCDPDHHGIAVVWAPRAELSHYAYAWPDLNALGRVADRLRAQRDQRLIWGPSRHGPGSNHFAYHHDHDGAMVEHCSDLSQLTADSDYLPRAWPVGPKTLNRWGGLPPLRFLTTGYPIAPPVPGRPSWAMDPQRKIEAAGDRDRNVPR